MTSLVTPSDYDLVARVAQAGAGVRHGMEEFLTACQVRVPDPVWHGLRGLEFDSDVAMLREWLVKLLELDPVPDQVNGLYFGLAEYKGGARDSSTCRLTLVGGTGFDPADEACQWAVQPTYTPRSAPADSDVLNAIYRQVQEAGPDAAGLGEYMLGLGYACLAARSICGDLRVQVLGRAPWRGVAVGFDCGYAIPLGRLQATGWIASSN